MKLVLVIVVCMSYFLEYKIAEATDTDNEENRAMKFMDELNKLSANRSNRESEANWAYSSNMTDATLRNQLEVNAQVSKETKASWREAIKFNWRNFNNESLKRQFMKTVVLGTPALPEVKLTKLESIINKMERIYSTAKICAFHTEKCDLALDPDLENILIKSRNPDELTHIWKEFRRVTGNEVKDLFTEYVALENDASRLNNFTDNGEYWLSSFEAKDFKEQIEELWQQIKPLYLQLHAYVRFKLRGAYGGIVSKRGPIPVHLLGNMWAQSWSNIAEFTLPYPGKHKIDVTKEMRRQHYTPKIMYKLAEDFYKSLNLSAMPKEFWERSIIEKPRDGRELVCHASAWDFYNGTDFRIMQCTRIEESDLYTIHHEMGHVEYYIRYKDQPITFQEGANDGFHEAVGDVMALSVSTTKHLKKIGLIDEEQDSEAVLNNLYKVGLDKIVFLPFAYLMDLWRWDVFSGKITPKHYNCKWWKLRNDYQGLEPPDARDENDFDPGAKYHIVADVPYIRYFVSFVIQFQFHRSLCEKAGEYVPGDPSKPLHECDIYNSTEAGNALKEMLQMGSSRPWPDAMEKLTGQRKMNASGLLEYFSPLQKWLEEENKKSGVKIGWKQTKEVCGTHLYSSGQQVYATSLSMIGVAIQIISKSF